MRKDRNFFILLGLIFLVLFVVTLFASMSIDTTPYATGRYGRNVVHPSNPYTKWVWICMIGAFISFSLVESDTNKKH